MKSLNKNYHINAPISSVWQALVDPKIIDKWGGGKAVMDDKVGTKFKLWDGDIHGENLEVIPGKKLVQDWISGDWESPSKVTFSFKFKGDETEVELKQTDIPDSEVKGIDEGWD